MTAAARPVRWSAIQPTRVDTDHVKRVIAERRRLGIGEGFRVNPKEQFR